MSIFSLAEFAANLEAVGPALAAAEHEAAVAAAGHDKAEGEMLNKPGRAGVGVGEIGAPRAIEPCASRKRVRVTDEAIQAGASVALRLWGEASTAYVVEEVFLAMLEHTELH